MGGVKRRDRRVVPGTFVSYITYTETSLHKYKQDSIEKYLNLYKSVGPTINNKCLPVLGKNKIDNQ